MTSGSAAQTTVVIPVWDEYVGERLIKAVRSLARENGAARIVVVDNASRVPLPELEGTEVIRSAARLTLGAARNLGLEHATTPYVVLWDADDVMLPGTLPFLETAIETAPAFAAFGAAIVEEPSGLRHRWPRRWMVALARLPAVFSLLNCAWSLYPTTGATIMRTELVRDAGGYSDAESGDDWSLGVALAFRGRIGWSERPGRMYLLHGQSVWSRHLSVHHQVAHARAVRGRIRTDPGIPRWARRLLPLILAGQYAAVAIHLLVSWTRGSSR